jgi:AcrR family transcriptional regulator
MPRSSVKTRPKPRAVRPAAAPKEGNSLQSLKRQLVREEILRSAAQLFADRGVHDVSIDEVASGLGYTKSAVYYYFKSKDELLWGVFAYISGHFVGAAERIARSVPDPVARLTGLVRMHVHFLVEHKEWATVFYRDVTALSQERQEQVRAIIIKYDAYFRQAVQDGAARGRMRPLPANLVVNAVLGACNWLVNWISSKHHDKVDEIADTFVTLFNEGLVLRQPSEDNPLGQGTYRRRARKLRTETAD